MGSIAAKHQRPGRNLDWKTFDAEVFIHWNFPPLGKAKSILLEVYQALLKDKKKLPISLNRFLVGRVISRKMAMAPKFVFLS